ncbi:hypothetical protein CEXT_736041 [Caerostris extrusa]|uniref:Secreted protein n=1 Tax=Caerostris extrusa TaxID=172846 RepID=A0AAV4TJS3_CAEEX|nr:hypothetical protein CEXT_736041 [Caerostris extrusa]
MNENFLATVTFFAAVCMADKKCPCVLLCIFKGRRGIAKGPGETAAVTVTKCAKDEGCRELKCIKRLLSSRIFFQEKVGSVTEMENRTLQNSSLKIPSLLQKFNKRGAYFSGIVVGKKFNSFQRGPREDVFDRQH